METVDENSVNVIYKNEDQKEKSTFKNYKDDQVQISYTDSNKIDHKNDNGGTKKKKIKNKILVSNTKKPIIFYLNLAKKYLNQFDDLKLCALGMAIPTVITIAEFLKEDGLATQKQVLTSTLGIKAKIEIVLQKVEAGGSSKITVVADSKRNEGKKIGKTAGLEKPKPMSAVAP